MFMSDVSCWRVTTLYNGYFAFWVGQIGERGDGHRGETDKEDRRTQRRDGHRRESDAEGGGEGFFTFALSSLGSKRKIEGKRKLQIKP